MCGIAGLVTWSDPDAQSHIERMTAALAHRGPDDSGNVADDGVFLGHRRLIVVDPSPNGRQPMTNEDGSISITYNGELYDTDRLRSWLEGRGHRFRSRTDTEVLLHLYEEKGPGCLLDANGMFAFAIHDRRRRRLLLARDRLGIKPLYFSFRRNGLLFASEIKAILTGVERAPSLRPDALAQYLLQGFISAPDTVFEGIFALAPGHYLDLDLEGFKRRGWTGPVAPVEYWDAVFTGDDDRPVEAIEADLEERLRSAVSAEMVADVPLGAFLSGGIDSSTVVALMARATREPVRTFTVDLPGSDRSERDKAQAVARMYNTAHVQVDSTAARADEYWRCQAHHDAPFNCASLLNAWLISRAARQRVTVALSGDGGDELFGGYPRYLDLAARRPRSRTGRLVRAASDWLPDDLRGRARLAAAAADDCARVLTARHTMAVRTAERLTGSSLADWWERMRAIYARYPADRLTRARYADLKTYLPDHVLAKIDSASMAVSLEVRPPLLDYRLVELAGRIPTALLVRNGTSKWILKRLVRAWLPDGLIDQAKTGFDPPLATWLFDVRLAERLADLSRPDAAFRCYLDGNLVDRWIKTLHVPSAWHVPRRAALWSIYQLDRWLQARFHPESTVGTDAGRSAARAAAPDARPLL